MTKNLIRLGSLMALLAVALGAFGAHGLKEVLTTNRLAIFETGIRYHFYHSFALLITAGVAHIYPNSRSNAAGWCFFIGILLFSGSLYLLACRDILNIAHWAWLGPLTPIGGLFFIIGWALLFLATNGKQPPTTN